MKICTRCYRKRASVAFYKDASKKDGLTPQCKTCKGLSPQYKTLEERFWEKVNKTKSCWLWTAAMWPNGYGHFKMPTYDALAHRVSWEFVNGPIPEGMDILHDCPDADNKACVNPDHLWLGTQLDNTYDAIEKGQIKYYSGSENANYGKLRSFCKNGHRLIPVNVIKYGRVRRCKVCYELWKNSPTSSYQKRLLSLRKPPPQPRWAKNYDACIKCHSTKYKHNARGYCKFCYQRRWLKTHK